MVLWPWHPLTCVRRAALTRRDRIGTGEGWGPRPPLWLVRVSVVLCVCVCVHPFRPDDVYRCVGLQGLAGALRAVRGGGRGAAAGDSPVRREVTLA